MRIDQEYFQGVWCSIYIPSVNDLWESSTTYDSSLAEGETKELLYKLRRSAYTIIKEPEIWDDQMIITHAKFRGVHPCTPQNKNAIDLLPTILGRDKSPSDSAKFWIEVG